MCMNYMLRLLEGLRKEFLLGLSFLKVYSSLLATLLFIIQFIAVASLCKFFSCREQQIFVSSAHWSRNI